MATVSNYRGYAHKFETKTLFFIIKTQILRLFFCSVVVAWFFPMTISHLCSAQQYMPQGSHIGVALKLPKYCSSLSLLFGAQNRSFHQIDALNVRINKQTNFYDVFLGKYIKKLCAQ